MDQLHDMDQQPVVEGLPCATERVSCTRVDAVHVGELG